MSCIRKYPTLWTNLLHYIITREIFSHLSHNIKMSKRFLHVFCVEHCPNQVDIERERGGRWLLEKLFKGTSVTAFRIHWTTCPPSDVLHSQIGALGGETWKGGKRRGKDGQRADLSNTSRGKNVQFPPRIQGRTYTGESLTQSVSH